MGGLRALVTPHMISVVSSIADESDLPDVLKNIGDSSDVQFIATAELTKLCKTLNARKLGSISLSDVLTGSELSVASLPEHVPNPELQARLARIKCELEQKEYNEMVSSVATPIERGENLGQQYRDVTKQTTVVFNSFLTVIGSFFFAFFAVRYIGLDVIAQVSAGLFVGMLVFFADLYFLMKDEFTHEKGVPASTKHSLAGSRSKPPSAAKAVQEVGDAKLRTSGSGRTEKG